MWGTGAPLPWVSVFSGHGSELGAIWRSSEVAPTHCWELCGAAGVLRRGMCGVAEPLRAGAGHGAAFIL